MEAANRKLIRPSFQSTKERVEPKKQFLPPIQAPPQKKPVPPENTNAENFYYTKQIQLKTPMVVVLKDGEQVKGILEWYDRACLKIAREGATAAMIYKPAIKYMYKAES